jgi:hypothetical protein
MQLEQQSSTDYLDHIDWTLECESVYHDNPNSIAVDHGGPATYYVEGPCAHTTGFRCEPAALSAMALARLVCDRCRSSWPRDRFSYRRL